MTEESMQIKDIVIDDIKKGTSWRQSGYNGTEIEAVTEILHTDYIFHSAVVLTTTGEVYPGLIAKSYSDGGEIGELHIYYDGKWQQLDKNFSFLQIEDYYYPNPQIFDIHLSSEEKQEYIKKFNENVGKI